MQEYGLTYAYPFLQREKDEASWTLDKRAFLFCHNV